MEELIKVKYDKIEQILEKYKKNGFVIIDTKDLNIENKILYLAEKFNLGNISNTKQNMQYYSEKILDNGLNIITNAEEYKSKNEHEAFQSCNYQGLHVDGTFQPIGTIKTVFLECINPAKEGGESIVCQTKNIIIHLKNIGYNISPLLDKNAFRRVSRYKDNDSEYTDCVLKYDEEINDYIIRYSQDSSADWITGFEKVKGLENIINKIFELSKESSDFYYTFKLEKGDILLLNNEHVTHGRKSFIDEENNLRKMIRGCYKKRIED